MISWTMTVGVKPLRRLVLMTNRSHDGLFLDLGFPNVIVIYLSATWNVMDNSMQLLSLSMFKKTIKDRKILETIELQTYKTVVLYFFQ